MFIAVRLVSIFNRFSFGWNSHIPNCLT